MGTIVQYHLLNFIRKHPDMVELAEEESHSPQKSSQSTSRNDQNLLFRTLEINQRFATVQAVFIQEKWLSVGRDRVLCHCNLPCHHTSPPAGLMMQQFGSWMNTQEMQEHTSTQKLVPKRSQQHYSQYPRSGKNPDVYNLSVGKQNVDFPYNGILFSH